MKNENCRRVLVRLNHPYDIIVGSGTLQSVGAITRKALGESSRRIVLISNRKVFGLFAKQILAGRAEHNFKTKVFLLGDGERYKSFRALERALSFLASLGLERSDAIVALGGGVVGDLAGLVAALYMRGIAFIQVPTTLLAQIDASVGGKTGVNLPQGKNLVGAFHQPRAVIIDIESLQTLPKRELTSGWCEAIKQGAVAGRSLFDDTRNVLEDNRSDAQYREQLISLIDAHCCFKASVVAGDEYEAPERTVRASRRILNFGHTVGHALEAVTAYRRFKHGEAVGYGMMVAGEISRRLGLLKNGEFEELRQAIQLCGPLPRADDLEQTAIIRALQGDKKSAGGQMKWVLLQKIGSARVVDAVPPRIVRESIDVVINSKT